MNMRPPNPSVAVSLLAFVVLAATCCLGQDSVAPAPKGKRLRQIVKENFKEDSVLVGAAIGSGLLRKNPTGRTVFGREFSYVTPENDFKHMTIRADPNAWQWSQADAWVDHVVENRQVLRMHGPIGPQCSRWAKDDARTARELESELKVFIKELGARYGRQRNFRYYDVVNETVFRGKWHTDKPGDREWECPWFKIGQDSDPQRTPLFIAMAFEVAGRSMPGVRFIYNQDEGPERTDSWDLIKKTIAYLRQKNLRVDGIGWQAHVDAGWETPEHMRELRNLIAWAHAQKLEFHVTEASVFLKRGASEEQLKAQAKTYAAILRALLEKRGTGVVAWNTWHVTDAIGWHVEWLPSIFDAQFRPKPAYYAVQEVLLSQKDR